MKHTFQFSILPLPLSLTYRFIMNHNTELLFHLMEMELTRRRYSNTFSHNDFRSFIVSLQKSSNVNIPVSFSFFAF